MKRRFARLTAVICAVLLLAVFAAGCTSDAEREAAVAYYDLGVEAYQNKDFLTAREYFKQANGFGNAEDYLEAIDEYERLYLEGVDKLGAKDYDGAKACFEAVSGFSNADEYSAYIEELHGFYSEALKLYGAQDFVLSRERFVQSCGYARADEYIASIDNMEQKYQEGKALYDQGLLRAAIATLESIGANYKDTYDFISSIYGELERGGVKITDYLAAYLKSHEAENDPIAFIVTDINETGFMVSDTPGLLFTGNTNERGIIESISFWVDESIVDTKGRAYVNSLLAHCIRALDFEMMSYRDVLANIDEYTGGLATYGNFSFELLYDESGYAVLNATYIFAQG